MTRKAISPVVATLVLIVIAVVAAVAVFGFIQGFVAQTTSQSQAPSSVVIDAAAVASGNSGSSTSVTVIVRNIGSTNAKITAVYLLNPDDLSLWGSGTLNAVVTTSSIATLTATNVTLSTTIGANQYVIIKVVTADGSSATYRVKAT